MKTESEKIEISKQVAEIVGRQEKTAIGFRRYLWLVDDHGACAEIAADRRISQDHNDDDSVIVSYAFVFHGLEYIEDIDVDLADFPSRIEATNWAICEAVIEQAKQS